MAILLRRSSLLGTPINRSPIGYKKTSDCALALGSLRSYAFLIQYSSDFTIAQNRTSSLKRSLGPPGRFSLPVSARFQMHRQQTTFSRGLACVKESSSWSFRYMVYRHLENGTRQASAVGIDWLDVTKDTKNGKATRSLPSGF